MMDKSEYKKCIDDVKKLCLSYGLIPKPGNHGRTLEELDFHYDSKYIDSCGEIVRLWPEWNEKTQYIVLFNKLYASGSCYYWTEERVSEQIRKKRIQRNYHLPDNIVLMEDLYTFGMDLIKETIIYAINDMKKFDNNFRLKMINKDFQ